MNQKKIKLANISFKSSVAGSYKKDFGKTKDSLRAQDFPLARTSRFIDRNITEKLLKKIEENSTPETILVNIPSKQGAKATNIIPNLYAAALSEKTGKPHLDLNDCLEISQYNSARGSYSSMERSEDYFNIGFKSERKLQQLVERLSGRKVLLVDDVLTTGETLVAMATFLKNTVPGIRIEGGNAMAAVDIRKPTSRDLDRVSEKLKLQLDPGTDPMVIRETVENALSNFTRKKLMRFETGMKTSEGARRQYRTMQADIMKIQSSLRESLAGNQWRYPEPGFKKGMGQSNKTNRGSARSDIVEAAAKFHIENDYPGKIRNITAYGERNPLVDAFFKETGFKLSLENLRLVDRMVEDRLGPNQGLSY